MIEYNMDKGGNRTLPYNSIGGMHMKRILATLLALLCAVAPLAAFTEMQAEPTLVFTIDGRNNSLPELYPMANVISVRNDRAYRLLDLNGSPIDMEPVLGFPSSSSYEEKNSNIAFFAAEGSNGQGIMTSDGRVISVRNYGDVETLSDRWIAGVVLEKVSAEPYDYTGQHRIASVDMYYRDAFVATLTRAEYKSCNIYGDFIYIASPAAILDCTGNKTACTSTDSFWYYSEYNSELDSNSNYIYWHQGSGQQAFTPGCTLTADMVKASVLYDGKGNFIDLQGNVLFSTDLLQNTSRTVLKTHAGKYVIIRSWSDSIYYMFDLQGNVIVSTASLIHEYNPMALGYQLYTDSDGFLHYVDGNGNQTAEFTLRDTSAVDVGCELYNLPFLYYQNSETGLYNIITAEAGKLNESYDKVVAYSAYAPLLGVKKGDKVGVIDLQGNTVIDFQYINMKMSNDGRLMLMQKTDSYPDLYHVYRIDYTDPAAEEAARLEAEAAAQAAAEAAAAEEAARLEAEAAAQAAAEAAAAEEAARLEAEAAAWHCDACDRDNDLNFCPGCGAARPVPPPVCSSCGYEAPDASYRFCPSCGQAF